VVSIVTRALPWFAEHDVNQILCSLVSHTGVPKQNQTGLLGGEFSERGLLVDLGDFLVVKGLRRRADEGQQIPRATQQGLQGLFQI
jgi:hypothetical protein